MENIYEKALDFATEAHQGQKRWNGDDYITHPIRIANNSNNEFLKTVAILHDVVEDTKYTFEDIEKIFGLKVTQTLRLLTHNKEEDSYTSYIKKIKYKNVGAKVYNLYATYIKKLDIMDNLKDLTQKQKIHKYELALLFLRD